MLVVNKLRGLRVQDRRGLFSLEKGRFTFLPGAEFPDSSSTSLKIPAPIPHSATLFSTGSPDLDMMLNGGIRKGSSLLIRSEEHTSELQSHSDLVCRLLL